ncbi:MAG: hypothetical protein ACK5LM_06420, partial [Lactovum sp.]
ALITNCESSWQAQDQTSSVRLVELSGKIAGNSAAVVELSMNDNSGGSLLLRDEVTMFDLVGWGNSVSAGVCKQGELAPIPPKYKTIKRYVDNIGRFINTQNNYNDFTVDDNPLSDSYPVLLPDDIIDVCPNIDGLQMEIVAGMEIANGVCVTPENQQICDWLVLSEILPNPSGSDSGNEYIEVSNPTQRIISLDGCSISVNDKLVELAGEVQPEGYYVVKNVSLPNASGGTVILITTSGEEVVIYPPDLRDDEAFALIDGEWLITNQPTEGTPNKGSVLKSSSLSSSNSTELAPCPEGKFRNPDTNRCKNIGDSGALTPCKEGQVRNPETNRCKAVISLASALKPCNTGQERNPNTNRCRKVSADGSDLKPCAENQERNPETNRCRKVVAAASTDVPSDTEGQNPSINYVVIAIVTVVALGYGVFEYRTSIANGFLQLKQRYFK